MSPDANTAHSDGTAVDPATMLRILEHQQRAFTERMAAFVPWILAAWGIAWTLGFLALWLVDGLRPAFGVPVEAAGVAFAVLMGAALVISAVLGSRSGRGIRSTGRRAEVFTGTVYGCTWSLALIALWLIGVGLVSAGMDSSLLAIFYPTAFTFLFGLMYLLGSAIWRAVPMLVLGVWLVVLSAVAPFVGYPDHLLLIALLGGIPFLGLAIAQSVRLRRLSRLGRGIAA